MSLSHETMHAASSIKNLYLRTQAQILIATGGMLSTRDGAHILECSQLPADVERNQVLLPYVPNAMENVAPIAASAGISPMTFSCPGGAPRRLQAFSNHGFQVSSISLLQWSPPRRLITPHRVQVLMSDADWEQATTLRFCRHAEGMTRQEFKDFTRRRMSIYRRACDDTLGQWFGIFEGPTLAAVCGLMYPDGRMARFRLVLTHPRSRKRGYAQSLVQGAAQYVLDTTGVTTVLIAALRDSRAHTIYERAGFREIQTAFQVTQTPSAQ